MISTGHRAPARVGLTGGIGSGKSTAAAMFVALGVPVLDLDAVGHRVVESPACLRELAHVFGSDILKHDGTLNHEALARLAFASDDNTRRLNAVVHPRIWRAMEEWLRGLGDGVPYALIEASVLIESGGVSRMDAVVAVLADVATRRHRVCAARGWSMERVNAVMARQCDDVMRRRVADFVLENHGSLAALRRQVVHVHRRLLDRFAFDKPARGE